MKKIIVGLFALTMTFASMAQTSNQQGGAKQEHRRGGKGDGAGYMEKLNLTDAQKTQVKTLNDNFRQQMQDLKNQGSLTVDQQKEKRQALAKEHRDRLEAILTPEQKKQAESFKKDFKGKKGDFAGRKGDKDEKKGDFTGMRKGGKDRVKGNRADKFADVTKDLNLSADQSKIASLNANFKSNLQNLQQNSSLSKDDKKEQMKSLMQKHRSELEALLTADQKKDLKSRMKNRPNRSAVK